jgi:hypothetical protein
MKRMRMLLALSAAAAGAGVLAACTHELATISLNPDYRLGFDDKGESVALYYGVPNSDDLSLMLECAKGSGQIELTETARSRSTTVITLTAASQKTRVPVRFDPEGQDGSNDPTVVTGHLALAAPALVAFRRSGVMEVADGHGRYVITTDARAKAAVERFFKTCGR